MKKFPVKLSVAVYLLLTLSTLLALGGVIWNIYSAIKSTETLKIVLAVATAIISLVVLTFALSVALFSRYIVKDAVLIAKFGFFTAKYEIKSVVSLTHFKKTDKLVLYFEDATFTTVIIHPTRFDEFIHTIRENNKLIKFDTSDEDIEK